MAALLKVKNLAKRFGDFKAVNDVSFDADEGEILGLLGPNGAGKTTTIRVIATILTSTGGTAEVCGFDILKSPEGVRKNIGVLTTEIGVYGRLSGRENLRYFGELYSLSGDILEKRIDDLVDLLEMRDFIEKKASTYSTGMKQKLSIARSVMHNPKVIIFDEPTSGLDVLASQTVINFMRKAKDSNKCVVFSTHRMSDAEKLCDRVAIMHNGQLIACDSVESIKTGTGTNDLEDAFLKLVRG